MNKSITFLSNCGVLQYRKHIPHKIMTTSWVLPKLCNSGFEPGLWRAPKNTTLKLFNTDLVGGFNPFEKYARQIGSFFPGRDEHKKIFKTTNQYFMVDYNPYMPGLEKHPLSIPQHEAVQHSEEKEDVSLSKSRGLEAWTSRCFKPRDVYTPPCHDSWHQVPGQKPPKNISSHGSRFLRKHWKLGDSGFGNPSFFKGKRAMLVLGMCIFWDRITPLKFNSPSLKSDRNPIGKDRLPTINF